MKITPSRKRGAVLVSTMVILGVLAITLLANLTLINTERRIIGRDQAWNSAIPMCEAGLEDALAHLNYSGTTNLGSDGWVLTNGNYLRTNALSGGYYSVTISTASAPAITSHGYVPIPNQTNYITRTLQVTTALSSLFPRAVFTKGAISLGGNAVIDSFNSTNSLYSTSGQYDAAKAEANAQLGSTEGAAGAISIGNGLVYGSVDTGPGGTVTIGANGAVGDAAWDNNSSNQGKIESGHSAADINSSIPDVSLPSMGSALTPGSGVSGGTNYTYVLGAGTYEISGALSMAGHQNMVISAPTVLYITGNFSIAGQAYIYVAPGGSLQLYVAGSTVNMAGNGIVNATQTAGDVAIWGLPTCTSLSYAGNANFIGTIFAPEAAVSIAGNGSASGAVVAQSFSTVGNGSLHYDEALGGGGTAGYKYQVTSWQEQ